MDNKNVHILVPKGFQNKQILRPNKGISHDASDTPAEGECVTCRGSGAIPHRVWLEDFTVVNGHITQATVKMAWFKCKCYKGQFWLKFHPANVEAILVPKWEKELREMKEREKAHIIQESGGNYTAGQDTFLSDLGYKAPAQTAIQKTFKDMNFGGIVSK